MSGNVLLAYWTDSVTVRYALAYGFVLILWGPLTHLLVVPAVIRLRRTAENPTVRRIVRHGSKINFATFLVIVAVVGTLAPGVMLLDFSSGFGTDGGDVTAELVCQTDSDPITCELETAAGVDHVVLLAGGEEIDRNDEPPYAFRHRDSLSEGPSGSQFVIELRGPDGDTLRRFVRTRGGGVSERFIASDGADAFSLAAPFVPSSSRRYRCWRPSPVLRRTD